MPAESKQITRKRGGQKGNQNARKHGFYSSILNPDEINSLGNLLNQEHIDPGMAVLRVKLQSFIQRVESQRNTSDIQPKCTPADRRLIGEVSRLIVKWAVKNYRLNRADRAKMRAAVDDVLERYSGISICQPSSFPQMVGNPKNELSSVGRKI
jgi:hypothetical protein